MNFCISPIIFCLSCVYYFGLFSIFSFCDRNFTSSQRGLVIFVIIGLSVSSCGDLVSDLFCKLTTANILSI